MNSIKTLARLEKLHQLINQERTGTPKELATRMHLSERLVYNLIDRLKEYDAMIEYDRSRKTYYYCDDFQFCVNLSLSINGANKSTNLLQSYSA